MPLNLVSMSPMFHIMFWKKSENHLCQGTTPTTPPTIKPIAAPISPNVTNHQTIYGRFHISASSPISPLYFISPCCKNITLRGIRNKNVARGAGSLVLCEVLKIHIDENVIDEKDELDPLKLNLVSRYGKNWYGKTTKESLYEIVKPISKIGMGIDQLPDHMLRQQKSKYLLELNLDLERYNSFHYVLQII